MSKRRLTDDEKKMAAAWASTQWPDESVTVEDETDDSGRIMFLRVKTSLQVMPPGWTPEQNK